MQETFKTVLLFVTFSALTVSETGSHVAQDGLESPTPLSPHLHLSTTLHFHKRDLPSYLFRTFQALSTNVELRVATIKTHEPGTGR